MANVGTVSERTRRSVGRDCEVPAASRTVRVQQKCQCRGGVPCMQQVAVQRSSGSCRGGTVRDCCAVNRCVSMWRCALHGRRARGRSRRVGRRKSNNQRRRLAATPPPSPHRPLCSILFGVASGYADGAGREHVIRIFLFVSLFKYLLP